MLYISYRKLIVGTMYKMKDATGSINLSQILLLFD